MTLKIYDTMAKQKRDFQPIDPAHVKIYVCGPTVYDYAHIGNARPAVVFDVLVRLLRTLYPKVTHVANITDIDDKIMQRAAEMGEPIESITQKFTNIYREDMAFLNVNNPDIQPRATQSIPAMISMIENLIKKTHAYAAENHVLFDVTSMQDYGKLSHRNRDDMIAGARVEIAPYKKDPGDFVLWKPSDATQPGWDSPWGRGRPGWHIECSAMIEQHLGETIDVHGGGQDLIFPHHENELAQSECAHGKTFVNYWMHNGYLTVEGEKMSKSLGNFITIRDLHNVAPGEVVRLALLSAHYRQPIDWSQANLNQAQKSLDKFYTALRQVMDIEVQPKINTAMMTALKDDLNTPQAIAVLHDLATKLNKTPTAEIKAELLGAGQLLGVLYEDPESWFKQGGGELTDAQIEQMIADRESARANKDFATADALRKELDAAGIIVEDAANKTSWKRSR